MLSHAVTASTVEYYVNPPSFQSFKILGDRKNHRHYPSTSIHIGPPTELNRIGARRRDGCFSQTRANKFRYSDQRFLRVGGHAQSCSDMAKSDELSGWVQNENALTFGTSDVLSFDR